MERDAGQTTRYMWLNHAQRRVRGARWASGVKDGGKFWSKKSPVTDDGIYERFQNKMRDINDKGASCENLTGELLQRLQRCDSPPLPSLHAAEAKQQKRRRFWRGSQPSAGLMWWATSSRPVFDQRPPAQTQRWQPCLSRAAGTSEQFRRPRCGPTKVTNRRKLQLRKCIGEIEHIQLQ